MCIFAGIPILSIWVIGFPAYIFFQLMKNKNNLNDKETIMKYGLFFAGLNDNAYFWDVILTNTKKVILIIVTALPSQIANSLNKVSYFLNTLIEIFWNRYNFDSYLYAP
jgi:hypothetical protein